MLLSETARKLEVEGVETVGVVATNPERARLFFRYRPPRIAIGADPDLVTHQAYGLPNMEFTPELWEAVRVKAATLLDQLDQPAASAADAYDRVGRLDGYEVAEGDHAEMQRHRAQAAGQFLIDGQGIVRWANVECARDGLAGIDEMPSDDELLAAVRALRSTSWR